MAVIMRKATTVDFIHEIERRASEIRERRKREKKMDEQDPLDECIDIAEVWDAKAHTHWAKSAAAELFQLRADLAASETALTEARKVIELADNAGIIEAEEWLNAHPA